MHHNREDEEDEDKEEEVVDVNIDYFLENQYANQASQEPRRELAGVNISRMIQQYNAYQPDFGQKIRQETEEWIDPMEIINSESRKPFKIKHKTKLYKGVASGQNMMAANRQKLEEDRRQMIQFNLAGNNTSLNTRLVEEEKKVARKPPRVGSSKHKSKQQSLRTNYNNYSKQNDTSIMNQSNTLYSVANRSNRVTPPCPVKIPKEVTEGIEFLRSIRMMTEAKSGLNQSSHLEESKSPGSFIPSQNVILNLFQI